MRGPALTLLGIPVLVGWACHRLYRLTRRGIARYGLRHPHGWVARWWYGPCTCMRCRHTQP